MNRAFSAVLVSHGMTPGQRSFPAMNDAVGVAEDMGWNAGGCFQANGLVHTGPGWSRLDHPG